MPPSPSDALTAAELDALSADAGEGFWLLDLDRVRSNVQGFRSAFVARGWEPTEVAWSFKTLWIPAAVRVALECGCRPEVVSRHEFELAGELGFDRSRAIINGPIKTYDDLLTFARDGALINVDSLGEAHDLVTIATEHPDLAITVGLRVNVDIGQGPRGRFGLDATSGDVEAAYILLATVSTINVGGLHLHISGARDVGSFTRRVEALIDLADRLWPAGTAPSFLNIGGGFAGAMPESLAQQLGFESPTVDEYAASIVAPLLARWPHADGPTLIVEPGIALAADTMNFAARVAATKTIDGTRHAILNASIYAVKPALHRFTMPHRIARSGGRSALPEPTVLSGWSCVESDVLGESASALLPGDWVVFENCGAYTFVLNGRFIRPTPAVLSIEGAGPWRLDRRADTPSDWLSAFQP